MIITLLNIITRLTTIIKIARLYLDLVKDLYTEPTEDRVVGNLFDFVMTLPPTVVTPPAPVKRKIKCAFTTVSRISEKCSHYSRKGKHEMLRYALAHNALPLPFFSFSFSPSRQGFGRTSKSYFPLFVPCCYECVWPGSELTTWFCRVLSTHIL